MRHLAWLILVGCGIHTVPVPVVLSENWREGDLLAQILCDKVGNMPIVLTRPDVSTETVYHEMIHARQMLTHKGGCEGFIEEYKTNPEFRFDKEAEAYCLTMRRYGGKVSDLEHHLHQRYGKNLGLSLESTRERIKPWCGALR